MSDDERLLQVLGELERRRLDEEDRRLGSESRSLKSPPGSVRRARILAAIGGVEEADGPATPPAPVGRSLIRFLVAAAALVAVIGGGTWSMWSSGQADPLPAYALEVSGHVSQMRGTETLRDVVVTPSARLRVQVTPNAAVKGDVVVRGFVSVDGGLRPLAATLRPNERGVAILQGPAAEVVARYSPP